MTIVQEVLPGFVGEVELLYKGVSAMRRWKEWRKKEDGVTIVIVALSLTAILSMTALVIDLGLAFYHRAHLQAACDAAALAAAWDINGQPTTEGEACFFQNYSEEEKNSYSVENYKYEINISAGTVDTWGRMRSPTAFAKIFGVDYIEVGAYAQAINAEIPDPKNPLGRTFTTDGPLQIDGYGQEISSLHSNNNIRVGGKITIMDSISSGGTIKGEDISGSDDRSYILGDPSIAEGGVYYDIQLAADTVLNNLKASNSIPACVPESLPAGVSGWPAWSWNSTETDSKWTKNGENVILNESAEYKGDVSINESDNIFIDHDLFIYGNLTLGGPCTIAEGATVYVTGNFEAGNGLVCNGNLVVLGNYNATGAKFTSTSSNVSYIYIGGKNTIEFGTAGAKCNNVAICAPNCSNFNIDGGDTTFVGSIAVKGSNNTHVGSGKFTITGFDSDHDPRPKVHVYRLSK